MKKIILIVLILMSATCKDRPCNSQNTKTNLKFNEIDRAIKRTSCLANKKGDRCVCHTKSVVEYGYTVDQIIVIDCHTAKEFFTVIEK